jgi:hypothetical protein
MIGSGLTSAELALYTTLGGAAIGGIIKLGTWWFGEAAKRSAERRTDLTTIITRQDAEIEDLRREMEEQQERYENRIAGLTLRVEQAERDRAQMEGVLYRMGWSKQPGGRWYRNGDYDTEQGGKG